MSDDADGGAESDDRTSDAPDDEGPSWPERVLMAASIIFTLVLFAFVVWQAVTTPATAVPTATVTASEPLPGGDVKVTVRLRNAQNVGLIKVTVEVDCETPPPELTFEHVPADDRRSGSVICPPGTTNATATVSSWTEA